MQPRPSHISTDVDLEADGLQRGFLRLPYSVHRSAYGWLPVPLVSIKSGAGPTVLLMAGNHGDEYEGQVALCKLIRKLHPDRVRGQIIILPMANYPAARSGLRTSPLDGGNLNRSFPGDPDGGPTAMIAHYIETQLLARADYLLDLHSGGSSLIYDSLLIMARPAAGQEMQHSLALLRSLGFARAILYDPGSMTGYSSCAATRQGAMAITAEVAGAGMINGAELAMLEQGLESCLSHIGCLEGSARYRDDMVSLEIERDTSYCYAMEAGLFEPAVRLGDCVSAGQIAGHIHDPATPWADPVEVTLGTQGVVVCQRVPARVERGDCLYEIGRRIEP